MKKDPHLTFSLYPDVYPVSIHVAYSAYEEKVKAFFRKATGEKDLDRESPFIGDASCARFNKHILIQIKPDPKRPPEDLAGLVSHEAVHATWQTEQAIGDCFNMDIQEPQAYFVQYLVVNIFGRIWDYLKKRK